MYYLDAGEDSSTRFRNAVLMALALHAALILGVSFSNNNAKRYTPQIEVTLASRPASAAPEDARLIAQANQEGSGDEAQLDQFSSRNNQPTNTPTQQQTLMQAPQEQVDLQARGAGDLNGFYGRFSADDVVAEIFQHQGCDASHGGLVVTQQDRSLPRSVAFQCPGDRNDFFGRDPFLLRKEDFEGAALAQLTAHFDVTGQRVIQATWTKSPYLCFLNHYGLLSEMVIDEFFEKNDTASGRHDPGRESVSVRSVAVFLMIR